MGGKFNETHPRLSSDGRWVAYVSDESGTREVYYLAHIAYLRRKGQIDGLVTETAGLERKAGVARKFIEAVVAYMKNEGANEDAALKNSLFADRIDKAARQN